MVSVLNLIQAKYLVIESISTNNLHTHCLCNSYDTSSRIQTWQYLSASPSHPVYRRQEAEILQSQRQKLVLVSLAVVFLKYCGHRFFILFRWPIPKILGTNAFWRCHLHPKPKRILCARPNTISRPEGQVFIYMRKGHPPVDIQADSEVHSVVAWEDIPLG